MATYNYILDTGVIVVDTAQILTDVQNEYLALFGNDLNLDPSTPQGILISAEALNRSGQAQNNSTLANQINPNLAGGQFLYALGQLWNSPPQPATFSSIPGVLLTGVPGTFIPAGSLAQSTTNQALFLSLSNVTLDITGQGQSAFQCTQSGAIAAPIGSLTLIVEGGVDGWETVYNAQEGILGESAQSDVQYRQYYNQTLGFRGRSVGVTLISAVRAVPGVIGMPKYLDNKADTTQVIEGITMVAHSIYMCINGGDDNAVATAMWSKKTAGANYNGSTTVTQTDPDTGQVYTVSFDRPTVVPMLVRVTALANPAVSDLTTVIQQAILDYANGILNGEPGLDVGVSVSPFELSGAINQESPSIFVKTVEVSYGTGPVDYVTTTLPIATNAIASIIQSAISVVIVSS